MNNDVFDEVVRLIVEVVGEDFLLDTEITPDTSFSEGLALESIEVVALGEKLQQRYGERVNLASFFSEMDIDEIMGMTVGNLAHYVEAAVAGDAQLADVTDHRG
jgi:acyl carrier protein